MWLFNSVSVFALSWPDQRIPLALNTSLALSLCMGFRDSAWIQTNNYRHQASPSNSNHDHGPLTLLLRRWRTWLQWERHKNASSYHHDRQAVLLLAGGGGGKIRSHTTMHVRVKVLLISGIVVGWFISALYVHTYATRIISHLVSSPKTVEINENNNSCFTPPVHRLLKNTID